MWGGWHGHVGQVRCPQVMGIWAITCRAQNITCWAIQCILSDWCCWPRFHGASIRVCRAWPVAPCCCSAAECNYKPMRLPGCCVSVAIASRSPCTPNSDTSSLKKRNLCSGVCSCWYAAIKMSVTLSGTTCVAPSVLYTDASIMAARRPPATEKRSHMQHCAEQAPSRAPCMECTQDLL